MTAIYLNVVGETQRENYKLTSLNMDDHGVVILPIFWLLSELYSDCLHSLIEADLTFLTTKRFFINFIVKKC